MELLLNNWQTFVAIIAIFAAIVLLIYFRRVAQAVQSILAVMQPTATQPSAQPPRQQSPLLPSEEGDEPNDPERKLSWRDYARQKLRNQEKRLTKVVVNDETPGLGDGPKGILEKIIEEETERDRTYLERKKMYWAVVVLYIVTQCAVAGLMWWFGGLSSIAFPTGGVAINIGLTMWLLQVIHLAASVKTVGVEDLPGIDFFGRPLCQPKPGLYVIPYFLLALTRANRNYRDVRFPGHPDKIFRVSEEEQKQRVGGDMPPVDSVRPIFVTTGEPRLNKEDEKKKKEGEWNPLDDQQSIEYSIFVRYRPLERHGGIFRLTRNLGIRGKNPEEIDDIIKDLMREQSERDSKEIITQHSYVTLTENLALVNKVFALRLQAALMRLGIQVDLNGAGLVDLNPSRGTNVDQAEARRAGLRRQKTIIDADAEEQKRHREGRGTAKAYAEIKKRADVDGEAVIASDTAKVALKDADSVVVGTAGVSELFGLVQAGKDMLTRTKQAKQPATPADTVSPQGGGS